MRVIVADDEPLARNELECLLRHSVGVEVVAACSNANQAREAIEEHDPDALFLDIEMPGTSGLELARDLERAGKPLIVFVTAYLDYAYQAFDVSPVDYVLKPAEPHRCRRAVNRVRRILAARAQTHMESPQRYLDRLFVKDGEKLVHLPVEEIESIEAVGNYARVATRSRAYIVRGSLASFESRLDPSVFIRTHRSHMVNIKRVRELMPVSHGDYLIVFADGSRTVPLSRVYRHRIEAFARSFRAVDESSLA